MDRHTCRIADVFIEPVSQDVNMLVTNPANLAAIHVEPVSAFQEEFASLLTLLSVTTHLQIERCKKLFDELVGVPSLFQHLLEHSCMFGEPFIGAIGAPKPLKFSQNKACVDFWGMCTGRRKIQVKIVGLPVSLVLQNCSSASGDDFEVDI